MNKRNYVDFDKMPYIYWDDHLKMSALQRHIIIHSILYYVYDNSVISDKRYDLLSKQLTGLMKENPEEYKKTNYYYCMYDFDGSTGFDLPSRLTKKDRKYLTKLALSILSSYQREEEKHGFNKIIN